jgi:preprotein translocase subunit SecA
MQGVMKEQVLKIIPHIVPAVNGVAVNSKDANNISGDLREVHDNAQVIGSGDGGSGAESVTKKEEVGRNDLCPCGSGKKYKKCHGV